MRRQINDLIANQICRLEDRGAQREKAFLMYQRFLAPGSENELNIDETTRKSCFTELSTSDWNRNLFNECQGEVVSLLEAVRDRERSTATHTRCRSFCPSSCAPRWASVTALVLAAPAKIR